MIFFESNTTDIYCDSVVADDIYHRIYWTTSRSQQLGLTKLDSIYITNPGIINEGLFKVITMFDFDADYTFSIHALYKGSDSIRRIDHCILGAYDFHTYNPGYPRYNGNYLDGAMMAECDETGIHWCSDPAGDREVEAFILYNNTFKHPIKMIGETYSNNIAEPFWYTDIQTNRWCAPMIPFNCNFSTNKVKFETFGLNMDKDVIGTSLWKNEKKSAPSIGSTNYNTNFIINNGTYQDMSATERQRYRDQIRSYMEARDPNKMFKLDIIEKTTTNFSNGISSNFIDTSNELCQLSDCWGNHHIEDICAYKFFTAEGLVNDANPSLADQNYYRPASTVYLEKQEYVIPVLFGKICKTADYVGNYGTFLTNLQNAPVFKYDINSKNSIFALAKTCIYENIQRQAAIGTPLDYDSYTEPLSIYTTDGGDTYTFSDAIDLRNISTDGAKRGKTIVNDGEVVVIANNKVYIVTEEQIRDYIFPSVNNNYVQ